MLIRKKVYFHQKFAHPCYSLGDSRNTVTLSYSVEHLTHIIFLYKYYVFCESYAEGCCTFWEKEQFKIKTKLKQRKTT